MLAWMAWQCFGAVIAGPAYAIGQQLGMHTSVVLVAVMMFGQPPVSELGLSMPLGLWNPGLIHHLPEEWMVLRAQGWLPAVLDCLMAPSSISGSQPEIASHS